MGLCLKTAPRRAPRDTHDARPLSVVVRFDARRGRSRERIATYAMMQRLTINKTN